METSLTIDLQPQNPSFATALPAPLYCNAEWELRERTAVFARSWQLLAHAKQLAAPGDHLEADIGGVPLWLLRDSAGELRALHNVCRHRAGPLSICADRGPARLRCRYHGWSYGLDGQLLSATEMQSAADFDPASIRLPSARIAEWNGLIFVCLDDDAAPLHDLVSGIEQRMGVGRLSDYRHARRVDYDIACNWKTYVDNYLEGYHLPHVHPALNRLLDYRSYQTECSALSSLQFSPLENSGAVYGSGEALYWYLWPNTMLNVLPGRLQTNRVIPLDAQRCRVRFDYYYPASSDAEAQARDLEFSDEVQDEDILICEQVQRGLASGSYVAGRLNPLRETGVFHFHELVRAALRVK